MDHRRGGEVVSKSISKVTTNYLLMFYKKREKYTSHKIKANYYSRKINHGICQILYRLEYILCLQQYNRK